ncbi:MAG TPA: fibronectin type III domain-containing protein [Solirubrobacteraceae bacterium]|jgi:hypothetical protein|nr:fibronectin type III domain-containing protein [Solirubrobacteraceae bacterium]
MAVLVSALTVCGVPGLSIGAARATALPPGVATGASTNVTSSSVTLGGEVNPHGQETSFYFEYGQTASYSSQTVPATAGNGGQTHGLTTPVGGLLADTLYHYRLVAVNPTGSTLGKDRTFTTKKIPLTFKVSAAPSRVVFGNPVTVSGTLSGSGSANRQLVLFANTFPFLAGFKNLGTPLLADANGAFSFSVNGLTQNTQLRVSTLETPPVTSGVIIERVAARVTLHVGPTPRHGVVRLYGAVAPAQVIASVSFQLLRPGHKPQTVATTNVRKASGGVSRFESLVPIRHGGGLYRASVQVLSGAQVSGQSRAVSIR